jgi:hypothetical protein
MKREWYHFVSVNKKGLTSATTQDTPKSLIYLDSVHNRRHNLRLTEVLLIQNESHIVNRSHNSDSRQDQQRTDDAREGQPAPLLLKRVELIRLTVNH